MRNLIVALTLSGALIPAAAVARGDNKHETTSVEVGRNTSAAILHVVTGLPIGPEILTEGSWPTQREGYQDDPYAVDRRRRELRF